MLASPIFFYSVSAHTKILMDRCQSLWVKKYWIDKIPYGQREPTRKGLFISVGATKGKRLFDAFALLRSSISLTSSMSNSGKPCSTGGSTSKGTRSHILIILRRLMRQEGSLPPSRNDSISVMKKREPPGKRLEIRVISCHTGAATLTREPREAYGVQLNL